MLAREERPTGVETPPPRVDGALPMIPVEVPSPPFAASAAATAAPKAAKSRPVLPPPPTDVKMPSAFAVNGQGKENRVFTIRGHLCKPTRNKKRGESPQ